MVLVWHWRCWFIWLRYVWVRSVVLCGRWWIPRLLRWSWNLMIWLSWWWIVGWCWRCSTGFHRWTRYLAVWVHIRSRTALHRFRYTIVSLWRRWILRHTRTYIRWWDKIVWTRGSWHGGRWHCGRSSRIVVSWLLRRRSSIVVYWLRNRRRWYRLSSVIHRLWWWRLHHSWVCHLRCLSINR